MSGHSKWAKIHRQKAAADSKKSAIFGKLSKQITIAAKKDPNPETNFNLRLAIDNAKAVNMPKDNVERAISKATSKSEALEEVMYEGYAPHNVAVMIEATTDNKNRLNQQVKTIFGKNNGKLAGLGAVNWMFEHKGVINIIDINDEQKEELIMELIDQGALDVIDDEKELVVYTNPIDLKKIKDKIDKLGFKIQDASLDYIAKDQIELDDDKTQQVYDFLDLLEENEDVSNIYTNLK